MAIHENGDKMLGYVVGRFLNYVWGTPSQSASVCRKDHDMTKKVKVGRDTGSGRFVTVPTKDMPNVVTERGYTGKIGSYSVRRVDDDRFRSATRAANTALKDPGKYKG